MATREREASCHFLRNGMTNSMLVPAGLVLCHCGNIHTYCITMVTHRNLAVGLLAGNGGNGIEFNSNYSLFSIGVTLTVRGGGKGRGEGGEGRGGGGDRSGGGGEGRGEEKGGEEGEGVLLS